MWFTQNNTGHNLSVSKEPAGQKIDPDGIRSMLKQNAPEIRLFFSACIHCTYCADTCFLQRNNPEDPSYMPSHKVIHSVGRLYKKRGKVTREELEEIRDILWDKCALCTRCLCPFQLNIPGMIALGRDICRSQGAVHRFDGPVPPVELPLEHHEGGK
ncbi:4Fe-4S dicluster domain-containing protein [Desulfobacter curvatus]|uniref:4Fe-4S dicluster domain-containing protein n=1 Tax=Desulfobacter curvatus TaxID=2290 RepID=UPI00036534DA|nr:4Fe-4S dicluster domain-containing protein [Desulfobacter curvatus]